MIPEENAENVNDVIVEHSLDHIWKVQIFSVSDLQSLVALTRTDRSSELSEAMAEFASLQLQLNDKGEGVLEEPATKEKLERILALAPNHESAKCLLAACNGERPTTLTRGDSLRRLTSQLISVRSALWNEPNLDRIAVSTVRIESMEEEIEHLEEICHEDLEPVFRQFRQYLRSLKLLLDSPNRRRIASFNRERQELVEELTTISVNREFIENALRN